MNHGLKPRHLESIRDILRENCRSIESVGLFGSRATGNYSETSNIDLVLYGDVSEQVSDRLYTCFLESLLPYKVDIAAYNHVNYSPLKRHIDASARTLYTEEQLYGEVSSVNE